MHHTHVLMQNLFTCAFCVHLDTDHSQIGRTNTHANPSLFAFGFWCSHLFDGVNTHDGHPVSWDHAVTQIPERQVGKSTSVKAAQQQKKLSVSHTGAYLSQ